MQRLQVPVHLGMCVLQTAVGATVWELIFRESRISERSTAEKSLGTRTYLFQLKTQKPSTTYNQLHRPGGLAGYPRARYTCRSIS